MKHARIVAAATAACLGVLAPALADYVRIGSVDVGNRPDFDTAYSRFGGRVESLRLVADRSDVFCRSITVRYANGDTDNVFSGRLPAGQPVAVDVRGRAKPVAEVHFDCRAEARRGGVIYVDAEIGRYRDEWRKDRDWHGRWSNLFGGDAMPPPPPPRSMNDRDNDMPPPPPSRSMGDRDGGWIVIDRISFEGRNDRDNTSAGWRGRRIDSIALRPLGTTARCNKVAATFRNGQRVTLATDRKLERDRMTVLDLPGDQRDLDQIYMRCHAFGDGRVTIEILGRK